ncbi:MAG TPA: phosphotransferase [Candidatus Limnocylindrales bacterium]|nr:phosphotransferase [Candidatus Limnocylindrales bacterium]
MSQGAFESLEGLLERHGLAGVPEEPFPNDGWSGARMTLLRRPGGGQYVLKRDSLARNWIARSTADGPVPREAWFAARGPLLPPPVRAPYLGAGVDGDEYGILMPDMSDWLFNWEWPISLEVLEHVLSGLAVFHAYPWAASGEIEGGPWCPLRERITLICRASLERPGAARDAVGDRILPGWEAFDRAAPAEVHDLVNGLGRDPRRLEAVLAEMPATLLHGDLKLANLGIAPDGSIDLVDWQMVMVGPVAVELGWFLVSNVASLPLRPDEVLERYRAVAGADGASWGRQVDAAILVGLLLRGWRKGADAQAGVVHASGVSAADDLAWWCERSLEAAERLL